MRIGVTTAWTTISNYGQILQAYALQKYLISIGHDVFLIKYDYAFEAANLREKRQRTLMGSIKLMLRKYLIFDFLEKYIFDRRGFIPFKNKNINFSKLYKTLEQLKADPPPADVYITGSDQIWGTSIARLEPFFLDFGNNEMKRIAYAPSFGRATLLDDEINRLSRLIQRFDAVGVREITGVDICRSLGFENAEWVPDPTILLKKEQWEKLASGLILFKTGRTKIFVYIVGSDSSNELIGRAVHLIDPDAEIICVSDRRDPMANADLTIGEWIKSLSSADYVVTNSFHGTMFCLLFNKEFITLKRSGQKTKKMNVRVTSLLHQMELDSRLLECINESVIDRIKSNPVDWRRVNSDMEKWRKVGVDFLERNLYKTAL